MLIRRVASLSFPYVFMALLCGMVINLQAQDTFYFTDGSSMTGTYQGMSGSKILFSAFNSSKVEKLKVKRVALSYNPQGTFRIYENGNERLINFINDDYDLLIQQGGNYVRASEVKVRRDDVVCIEYPTGNEVVMPIEASIAVIYRNKQLLPLADINEVVKAIWAAEQAGINQAVDSDAQVRHTSNPSYTEPLVNTQESFNDMVRGQNPGLSGSEYEPKTDEEADDRFSQTDDQPATIPNEGPRLPVNEEEFQTKALRKTQQFTNYINRIIDKNSSRFEANKAINQAITLFVNDTCFVEVSNAKTQKKTSYYIREYLYHIQELKYDRVEVEWAEINYVGDIKLGPDGNWYGTVTYLQVFKGFKDGQILYQDKTMKRMEVILRSYEKVTEGKTELLWDVLLSNIAVEHTS